MTWCAAVCRRQRVILRRQLAHTQVILSDFFHDDTPFLRSVTNRTPYHVCILRFYFLIALTLRSVRFLLSFSLMCVGARWSAFDAALITLPILTVLWRQLFHFTFPIITVENPHTEYVCMCVQCMCVCVCGRKPNTYILLMIITIIIASYVMIFFQQRMPVTDGHAFLHFYFCFHLAFSHSWPSSYQLTSVLSCYT